MSAFKESLQNDLLTTFFNPEDFGELHRVNGKDMLIVIDTDTLMRNQLKDVKGVYTGTILFYAREVDYGPSPRPQSRVTVDQRTYTVTNFNSDMGMYTITAEEVRA